jgi:hypothetical protein
MPMPLPSSTPNAFKIQPIDAHPPPPSLSLSERESRLFNSRNPSSSSIPKDNDATPAHASSSRTQITRGRIRSLRPVLIPPPSPPCRLLLTVIPTLEASFSNTQNTETDPSFSTTTVTRTGLPPNTVKPDIRPVLLQFGEVTRIFTQPDGRRADVVFAGVHGVERTL